MPRDRITIVTVRLVDSGGTQLKDVYICDYCAAMVPDEFERIHDRFHQSRNDRPLLADNRAYHRDRSSERF